MLIEGENRRFAVVVLGPSFEVKNAATEADAFKSYVLCTSEDVKLYNLSWIGTEESLFTALDSFIFGFNVNSLFMNHILINEKNYDYLIIP
jgi:hypothetical protein